jgi:hypothetical protein
MSVIIDVTKKPLMVLPDEMPDSVVVRSIGSREASGLVTFEYRPRYGKERIVELEPGARMVRGDSTCFETALMLPGYRPKRDASNLMRPFHEAREMTPYMAAEQHENERQLDPRYRAERQRAEELAEKTGCAVPLPAKILPEPFEVVSVFRDPVTHYRGTWRLGIRVERHTNGRIWVVTIQNMSTEELVCSLAVKGLDPNPASRGPFPLSRATRAIAGGTAWDRILDNE